MVAAMIIVAAPIFEEFIFRGLIFGGLRRSLDLPVAAIASAAIFAIVHPPASVIPVSFWVFALRLPMSGQECSRSHCRAYGLQCCGYGVAVERGQLAGRFNQFDGFERKSSFFLS